LLLFSDNATVARTTPVRQQLRELGVFSELHQGRPGPSGIPKERLEKHFLYESLIHGV